MKDFWDSLSQASKERLSSSFFFNFIFSWCVINWEIFLALFFVDDDELPCKNVICYIKLYHSDKESLLGWPLFWSIIITLSLPIINAFVDFFKRLVKKFRNKQITKKIDGTIGSTPEEFIELKNKHENLDKEYKNAITQHKSLSSSKQQLEDENLKLKEKYQEIQTQKNHLESKIDSSLMQLKALNSLYDEKIIYVSTPEDIKIIFNNQDLKTAEKFVKGQEILPSPQIVYDINRKEDWYKASRLYKHKLQGANWITGSYPISDEEATNGGQYTFEMSLTPEIILPKLATHIYKRISLFCLSDSSIEIEINNQIITNNKGEQKSIGYSELHEYDISKNMKFDKRCNLKFIIENNPLKNFQDQPEKKLGILNPYGFIFSIIAYLDKDSIENNLKEMP